MSHLAQAFRPALAIGAVAVLLAGCGHDEAVVRLRGAHDASIARATLDHWMKAFAGSDFRTVVGSQGPTGLASEPADYPRCLVAAKLVAPRSFFNQLRPTKAELERECRALHRAIKAQALAFLTSALRLIARGEAQHVAIGESTVGAALQSFQRRGLPGHVALRTYLAERHWTSSDLRYLLKVGLIAGRLEPALSARLASADISQSAQATASLPASAEWQSRTICARGYVVAGCSASRAAPMASPAPLAILKNLVTNPE